MEFQNTAAFDLDGIKIWKYVCKTQIYLASSGKTSLAWIGTFIMKIINSNVCTISFQENLLQISRYKLIIFIFCPEAKPEKKTVY